jgi:hypothetical protein
MGYNTTLGLVGNTHLTMEQSIEIHLTSNHYPPVPAIMVDACVEAIQALNEGDRGRIVQLPKGVWFQGQNSANAWVIVQQHHLEPWLLDED